MAVEREPGISVSTAVMSFEHQGLAFHLLDTPGRQDFGEDTYRTLTAVDSAVKVRDAAPEDTGRHRGADQGSLRGVPVARPTDNCFGQQARSRAPWTRSAAYCDIDDLKITSFAC